MLSQVVPSSPENRAPVAAPSRISKKCGVWIQVFSYKVKHKLVDIPPCISCFLGARSLGRALADHQSYVLCIISTCSSPHNCIVYRATICSCTLSEVDFKTQISSGQKWRSRRPHNLTRFVSSLEACFYHKASMFFSTAWLRVRLKWSWVFCPACNSFKGADLAKYLRLPHRLTKDFVYEPWRI